MKSWIGVAWTLVCVGACVAQPGEPVKVGPAVGGGMVVPTSQVVRPAGKTLSFAGRPVDAVMAPDGKTLYAKDERGVVVVDVATWKVKQEVKFPKDGASMVGMAVTRDGTKMYATDAANGLVEFVVGTDGKVAVGRLIELPGPDGRAGAKATGKGVQGKGHAFGCGIALSGDEKIAYVCLSRTNALGIVDLTDGVLVEEIPVGVAPFGVKLTPDGSRAVVTNWGGKRPDDGELSAPSSGTPALIDKRGIAASGTMSVVDLKERKSIAEVYTGLSASGVTLSADGTTAYVANANSDTVSVVNIATTAVVEQIDVKPDAKLPFGSMPNGVALSPDGRELYVSCAGNNAVAVVELGSRSRVKGYIPTAWYPGTVIASDSTVYVACIKGYGSRGGKADADKHRVQQSSGTISAIDRPDERTLADYSAKAREDANVPQALRAMERSQSTERVPVPTQAGQRSVFEHVVYVIKENRTFDQVLGDIGKGNAEPKLCVFGKDVTPNQHAIAEQFVLLDNFYCNGVCSADGHSWATEGNVTPYLERSFGGFHRSYTFGDDPLTFSSSGFVWDHVLAAGLSFRNYGEFDYAGIAAKGAGYKEVYDDFLAAGKDGERKIGFTHRIGVETMRRYMCPDYPGWDLAIPDVVRADVFIRELKKYEAGQMGAEWPNFMTVYLPCDHTAGTSPGSPTPRSHVADNDLAVGRVVEAISHSKYWATTAVFIIEDDPQDGWDHVDGHRSTCYVVSPYTKRGAVVSEFYNQSSVVHTMERILGITAMNQLYAAAPVMSACFMATPEMTPFVAVPNVTPLCEINKKTTELPEKERWWAEESMKLVLSRPDAIPDDTLNRIVWHSMRGVDAEYPEDWAGAHGRGLTALGLKIDWDAMEDDDDDD